MAAVSSPVIDVRLEVICQPGSELRVWVEGFELRAVQGGERAFEGRTAVKRGTHTLRVATCLGRDPMADPVVISRFEYTCAPSDAYLGELGRVLEGLHAVEPSAAIQALGEFAVSPDPEFLATVAGLASGALSDEVRAAALAALGFWLAPEGGRAIVAIMESTVDEETCEAARVGLKLFLFRQGLHLSDESLGLLDEAECGARASVARAWLRASDALFVRLLG